MLTYRRVKTENKPVWKTPDKFARKSIDHYSVRNPQIKEFFLHLLGFEYKISSIDSVLNACSSDGGDIWGVCGAFRL